MDHGQPMYQKFVRLKTGPGGYTLNQLRTRLLPMEELNPRDIITRNKKVVKSIKFGNILSNLLSSFEEGTRNGLA